MRPHIAALYAFARTADDFADEGRRPDAERLRLLDDWQNRLHACVTECALTTVCFSRWVRPFAPAIFPCRSSTICSARFVRISRRIGTTRGPSLLDYCRRSANPVGRLVLRIAGHDDATARSLVRCALHGAPVDQLLAGPRSRLAERQALRSSRGRRRRRRAHRRTSMIGG